ncbi:MAG: hypothetical protein FVQ80_14670 [Planctomycetes bacterium]|nr:hypothetical protein [Planctomycetota bacterium]
MEKKKIFGIILLVGGIIILILSLSADLIGIGRGPDFGFQQIAGTIVGSIIAVIGFFLILKK